MAHLPNSKLEGLVYKEMVGDDEPTHSSICSASSRIETPEFIEEKQSELSDGVSLNTQVIVAANSLSRNRNAICGSVIPAIRRRFGLNILQAIDATKQAHALHFPRVAK